MEEALRPLAGHVEPALEVQRHGVNIEADRGRPVEYAIALHLYALKLKQVLKANGQEVTPRRALEAAQEILDKIECTLALFPALKFPDLVSALLASKGSSGIGR